MAQLERDLASARSKDNVVAPSIAVTDRINTQTEFAAAKPIPTEQAVVEETRTAEAPTKAENAAGSREFDGVRANVLLGRGDIGSARTCFSAPPKWAMPRQAFALAETYDPLTLSKWGTYGTRGDAKRAR